MPDWDGFGVETTTILIQAKASVVAPYAMQIQTSLAYIRECTRMLLLQSMLWQHGCNLNIGRYSMNY